MEEGKVHGGIPRGWPPKRVTEGPRGMAGLWMARGRTSWRLGSEGHGRGQGDWPSGGGGICLSWPHHCSLPWGEWNLRAGRTSSLGGRG